MKLSLFTLTSVATFALAVPTETLQKRADYCGQYDSQVTDAYTVYNVRSQKLLHQSICTDVHHRTCGVKTKLHLARNALVLTVSAAAPLSGTRNGAGLVVQVKSSRTPMS